MRKPDVNTLVAGGVAGAAFLSSASHIFQVAKEAGNWEPIAALHAVGIDGLIFVGLRNIKTHPVAGWLATGFGVVVSLGYNLASYGKGGMQPMELLLALTMPVAMLLGFVVIHATHRRDKAKDTDPVVPAKATPRRVPVSQGQPVNVPPPRVPVPAVVPAVVPAPVVPPAIEGTVTRGPKDWDKDKARTLLAEGRPRKEIAELCGVSRKSIDRLADSLSTNQVDR